MLKVCVGHKIRSLMVLGSSTLALKYDLRSEHKSEHNGN